MVDASLLTLEGSMAPASLTALATPRGGEVIDADRFRREFDEKYAGLLASRPRPSAAAPGAAATTAASSASSDDSSAAPRAAAPAGSGGDVHAKLLAIGRAFLLHNQFFGMYTHPTGPGGGAHLSQLSWRVHLLPFLGQGDLYHRFHFQEPWDSPHNKALLNEMPEVFRLGAADANQTPVHVFSGPAMLFGNGRPTTSSHVKDGLPGTVMAVVLGPEHRRPWTEPAGVPFEQGAVPSLLSGIGAGNVECLMADGSLLSLPKNAADEHLEALLTPAGGEAVDFDALKNQYGVSLPPDPAAVEQVRDIIQMNQDRATKLKNIALAMLNFHDTYRRFPQAENQKFFDAQGRPHLSWRVHLLPFLEQQPLFDKFKLDEPWDSPNNRPLLEAMPDAFRDPQDATDSTSTRFVTLTGPETPFSKQHGPRMADIIDGTANTILVLLAGPDRAVPWTKPEDAAFDPATPFTCLGRPYGPGFNFVRVDGASLQLKRTLPPDLFKVLVTPAGKEQVPRDLAFYGRR
jgi:hypothetical protein